jgi:putative PIN family toxin of toxin-antitoxin system
MIVVLDTNTVISGLFWKGAPRRVLDLARDGLISLFTSPELLAELGDVVGREKFKSRLALAEVTVDELVYGYSALAQTIYPAKLKPVIKTDPDDDKVLACAKAAKANWIVSGDSHLLQLKKFGRIPIISANELLVQVNPAD